jgi:cytochrome c peroxidase
MGAGSAFVLVTGLLLRAAAGWPAPLPPGFPAPRDSADNPMSLEKAALGRRLFYDARLSGNGTQSCSSCHEQSRAFTDGRARALGSTGIEHPRSAMSLANAAYSASLTWTDAGVRSLERQAAVPLFNEHPVEMGARGHEREILSRLRAEPVYQELFPRAFPGEREPFTMPNVRRAIACFERTIFSGGSPYDRFLWQDEEGALSEAARRGMTLFFSDRLACAKCHEGFTFSRPSVWKGSPDAKPALVGNGLDAGPTRFRVPTLRNVAATAPYMHDGRFATLEQVVDHYARGGTPGPSRSPLVRRFALTAEERCDLIAFLESLTDEEFLGNPDFSDPWIGETERKGQAHSLQP